MSKSLWAGRNRWMLALALVAVPAAASTPGSGAGEPLDERESYAFARTVEGSVSVAAQGQGVGEALERNQPLLTGDRLSTERASRLELLLSDRNRLTLEERTSVRLVRLAFSGDQEARITILELEEGEILLEVSDEALGDELPRIESSLATIYVQEPGLYRIRTGGDGSLELVARDGYAEMVTSRGSTIVRAGEAAEAGGRRGGRIEISQAGAFDELEQWSVDVAQGAERGGASERNLDASIDYAASDLDQNGSWVEVDRVSYWRPRVSVGWRPYWDGRWAWTPSGYTWVSYEPWGWVPYHYGRWSLLPGYGWAWRPGAIYSPAWVYWHWSDGYAGWCPTGYYTDYYNPWYRGGYRWGSYGWAGGDWGYYSHWNFAPVNCFRNRNFRGHMRRGHDFRREHGGPEAPRGLITTDTRDFRPDRIDHPDQLLHRIRDRERDSTRGELPDVTDFVGRRRDLPPTVAQAIVPDKPGEPRLRIDVPKTDDVPAWRRERGARDQQADGGKRDAGPAIADSRGTPRPGGKPRDESASESREGEKPTPGDPALPERTVRSGGPKTSAPRTGDPSGGYDSRQGWKNTPSGSPTLSSGPRNAPAGGSKSDARLDAESRTSAPVERVISGTRRPAPRSDEGSSGASKPPTGGTGSGEATRSDTPTWQKPSEAAPQSRPRTDGGSSGAAGSSRGSAPNADLPRAPRSGSSYGTGGAPSPGAGSSGAAYRSPSSGKPSVSSPPSEGSARSSRSAPSTPRASGSSSSGGKSTPAVSSGSSGSHDKAGSGTASGSRGSASSGSSRSGSSGGSNKSSSSSRGGTKSSGSSSSDSSKTSGSGDKDD